MKPKYGDTIAKEREDAIKIFDRKIQVENLLLGMDFDARYSIDDMGKSFIRIFFYPALGETEFSVNNRRKLIKEIFSIFGSGKFKRDFRENEGTFLYICNYEHYFGKNQELYLLIEKAKEPRCTIKEKIVTKKIYVTDCKPKKQKEA